MADTRGAFASGDPAPFIELVEKFLLDKPIRTIREFSESELQAMVEAFWCDDGLALQQLWLIADPTKPGRYGFADFFMPSEQSISLSAIVELKSITLLSIWRGMGGMARTLARHQDLENLRKQLLRETSEDILKRNYAWYDNGWQVRTIQAVKDEAVNQVNNYMDIIKNGPATGSHAGIPDPRVRFGVGETCLDAHVVLCVGGTRILTWKAGTELAQYVFEPVKRTV
jgi:hypothetical protein